MNFVYKYLRHLKYSNIFFFKALIFLRQSSWGQSFSTGRNGVVLNCGGPRSGSTLLNIIIKEILLVRLSSENNYVDTTTDLSKKLSSYNHFNLIKTHRYFFNIPKLIKKGQVIAFMTHRDIRDVTVSLKQKGWVQNVKDFVFSKDLKQIAFSSIAYARVNGMNILSYEQLMDNPAGVISFVSEKLNVQLSEEQVGKIENNVSRENVIRKIETLKMIGGDESSLDVSTGLHIDHIKDGKSGKWKELLTHEEKDMIAKECSEYLTLFNY